MFVEDEVEVWSVRSMNARLVGLASASTTLPSDGGAVDHGNGTSAWSGGGTVGNDRGASGRGRGMRRVSPLAPLFAGRPCRWRPKRSTRDVNESSRPRDTPEDIAGTRAVRKTFDCATEDS